MSLQTQTKKIEVIIDFPQGKKDKALIQKLNDYLSTTDQFFYIVHENEISQNSGIEEFPHIHANYILKKRTRLVTELSRLVNELGLKESEKVLISICNWSSYETRIQYLIHKNNKEKKQYPITDICTNVPQSELNYILNREVGDAITIEYLAKLVYQYEYASQVFLHLGIVQSSKYRALIKDMYNDKQDKKRKEKYL